LKSFSKEQLQESWASHTTCIIADQVTMASITIAYEKLVIAGIGLLMIIQNYSFFVMFWDLWLQMGVDAFSSHCGDLGFWVSFDAFVCFYVTVMVCGMMLGGCMVDSSKRVWWFFFVAHLIGGLSYTVAVFKLGNAINAGSCFREDVDGVHQRISAVFTAQAIFYVPYCLCMASLFYQVVFKMSADAQEAAGDGELVVAGIGLLMVVQNFSFFLAYWDLWSEYGHCNGTSFWLAFDAFVCVYVTVMVFGMVLGGWMYESSAVWWFFFVAHLVGGLGYTVAVFKLGQAVNGDDVPCADNGSQQKSHAVFTAQAIFYVPYCLCMASLFFQVVFRMKKSTVQQFELLAGEGRS
jgi:hypothetical protein